MVPPMLEPRLTNISRSLMTSVLARLPPGAPGFALALPQGALLALLDVGQTPAAVPTPSNNALISPGRSR